MTVAETRQEIVDQIIEQLEPVIARQRKALVQQGCYRQISSTQLHVLYMLVSQGATPMSRLAEQLDVSLPNVTGLVERMVERGIVERLRPVDDRRVVEVRITAAGSFILDQIDMVKRQQMANVIARLTPDQQERALTTFRELRAATEQLVFEELDTQATANNPVSRTTRRH
jgi:DNA-binding MarR family transcriptional regulator